MKAEGKIQGGHLLAKAMKAKGINRAFGLADGFVNPLYDGLLEYGVELVGARSEQEAGFLACMQARISRRPAVCIAEPSGFTNYISAAAEAFHANDPVIFISANSIYHRWNRKGFKETQQARMMEPVSKYSIMVPDGARIPEFFNKAYHIANHHPTGPAQLSVPVDFLYSGYDAEPKTSEREIDLSQTKVSRPYPDPDDVAKVIEELNTARAPVIIAGGEAIWYEKAESELQDLSSQTKIPVFNPTWHIKMHDLTHEFNMGLADIHQNPASRLIYQESDLVLFLGCPLDFTLDFAEPPLINKGTKLITVNASAGDLITNHIANDFIISGVKAFLSELNKRAADIKVEPGWAEKIRTHRIENNKTYAEAMTSNERPIEISLPQPEMANQDALKSE